MMMTTGVDTPPKDRLSRRVSVVVPIYNGEEYLGQAIDSALAQTGCELDVILIDDGSTDSCPEIIASYGDRVRSVQQANAGCGASRARGVELADSEWVAFLDMDDAWEPSKLSAQLDLAEQTGADVIYTNARNFGDVDRVDEIRSDPAAMPSGDVFEELLVDNFMVNSGVMVRRSVLLEFGGVRAEAAGTDDWDLWLRLAAAGVEFQPVREPVTLYRWRADALSRSFGMMHERRSQTLMRALKTPRGKSVAASVKREAWVSLFNSSAWYAAETQKRLAAGWYARSLLSKPLQPHVWKQLAKICIGR